MAALASDWLRHFRLLLWNCWTEFNETWQEARSQRLLPSLCFSGRSVNKKVCLSWFLKKVADCTQVHDMWPFGPLVLTMTRSALSGQSANRQNPILHAVSPVSQNLPVESLNQFYIFLARKYALFGHSAYFRNHYGRLSYLRAKYGKSPQKILSIFTAWQHKFSLKVLIWPKYLSIMETTGWCLSIDMCFVLVHCCVGLLMTSCLWGATPILGRKRIALQQP